MAHPNPNRASEVSEASASSFQDQWVLQKGRVVYEAKFVKPASSASAEWQACSTVINYSDTISLLTPLMVGRVRQQEWQRRRADTREDCEATFFSVPGMPSTTILAFIKVDQPDIAQWTQEENVRVVVGEDARECCFGKRFASDALAFLSSAGRTTLLLTASADGDPNKDDLDTDAFGDLPSIFSYTDPHQLAEAIKALPVHHVRIRPLSSGEAAFRRSTATVTAVSEQISAELQQTGRSITRDLLLANRFDELPNRNVLEGLTQEQYDELARDYGDLVAFEKAPAGFVLVSGHAGTKPTMLATKILISRMIAERNNGARRMCALITSSSNAGADSVLKAVTMQAQNECPDALILRSFAKHIHDRVVYDGVDQYAQSFDLALPSVLKQLTEESDVEAGVAVKLLMGDIAACQHSNVARDHRARLECLLCSPPAWLMIACGLASPIDDYHPKACVQRLVQSIPSHIKSDIRNGMYHLQIQKEELWLQADVDDDEVDRVEETVDRQLLSYLDTAIQKGLNWVLSQADVVVTTCQQAEDPSLYKHLKANFYICVEASKVDAIDSLCFALYPSLLDRILVGDPLQLPPRTRCPANVNPYAGHLETSLFSRLLLADFPTKSLD